MIDEFKLSHATENWKELPDAYRKITEERQRQLKKSQKFIEIPSNQEKMPEIMDFNLP